jgi:thermitase
MNRVMWTILLLGTVVFGVFGQEASVEQYHPHRVLVKLKPGTALFQQLRQQLQHARLKELTREDLKQLTPDVRLFFNDQQIGSIKALKENASLDPLAGGVERIFVLTLADDASVQQAIASLSRLPEVEYAEPDFVGHGEGVPSASSGHLASSMLNPNDPRFDLQWGMKNTGQTIDGIAGTPGVDINIVPAWDYATGNPLTILAILDSGIPLAASEFSGRVMQGYDYANNDNDPTDDVGHGTNVASIAAATGNNSSLLAGVNWQCRILPFKILNASNSGQYSWWAAALMAAADSGAKIINMSVGGGSNSSTLQNAVTYAANRGSIIVACMMNYNNSVNFYPAAYSNVIAVGAINSRNQRAVPFCWGGGSNYGNHIDFTAPGDFILGLDYQSPDTFMTYWCGTSQATPMVSGIVSLMLGLDTSLTFQDVYDKLKLSAHDQVGPSGEDTPGFDQYFGWGRVDAYRAIQAVLPVQIDSFVATVTSSHSVMLQWKTLREVNNCGFEMQQRQDVQVQFETIPNSFVPGHGTTDVPQYYSYTDSTLLTGRLWYRLKQIGLDETVRYSEAVGVDIVTSVGSSSIPSQFLLQQNFPNPFNPSTVIRYQIPEFSHVSLKVFDILGREVATLVNEQKSPGAYTVQWNGSGVVSGVYLYRLTAGAFVETKKAVVLK